MSALEKNRFIPEESGRLVTAFLERFFERYVSYDYTAELEDELDDVSGGRLDWQKLLEEFWRDFKPKAGEVMEQKPSEVTAALDEFLAPWLFPPTRATAAIRGSAPLCGNGRLSLRGGKFGAFVACSNYPECKYTQKFGQGGAKAGERRPAGSRQWHRAEERALRAVPGARRQARVDPEGRAGRGRRCWKWRSSCCRCRARSVRIPRPASRSPPRSAATGRISTHDGKYARLGSTAEVFETGMNAAVAKLAEAAAGAGRRQRRVARADRGARRAPAQRARRSR